MRCRRHDLEFSDLGELLEHALNDHLTGLEQLMTEINDDQQHLEADVKSLQDSWTFELAQLKAQIGSNPTLPAAHLDFTSLDALAGVEKAATNTVPDQVPSNDPSLVGPVAPAVTAIGPVAVSPFVDPDGDGSAAGAVDGDADDPTVVDPNAAPVDPTLPSGGSTADPTQVSAPSSPGVTANAVGDANATPSTENPPSAELPKP